MRQSKTILDPIILRNLRLLQTPGEPDILCQLFEIFQVNAPSALETIRDAITQNDCAALYKAAHMLKGNSASVGAGVLAAQLKELEMMGRTQNVQGAAERLMKVEKEYQRAIRAMRHECAAKQSRRKAI